jgi:alcohol dehydrogenase class IV
LENKKISKAKNYAKISSNVAVNKKKKKKKTDTFINNEDKILIKLGIKNNEDSIQVEEEKLKKEFQERK